MDTAVAQSTNVASVLVKTTEIQKTLKLLLSFDPTGSPYAGVQFIEGRPAFFRSSKNGFAHTDNFLSDDIFIHLQHLSDCLKYLPNDVELSVAPNGVMRLFATNGNFTTTMHVHTVLKGQAGLTPHTVTGRQIEPKSDLFSGFDVSHIRTITGHPTITNRQIVIPVNMGAVIYSGLDSLTPEHTWSPQFSFLKVVSGSTLTDLYVSENGYWRAVVDGVVVCIKGHDPDPRLFRRMTLPGNEICQFTAEALLRGLSGAAGMIGDTEFVAMDPRFGVTSQDQFGNPAQWSLDQGLSWPKFHITGAQAKLIVNTLKQAQDEHIALADVPSDTSPLMRFSRGKFAVNVTL